MKNVTVLFGVNGVGKTHFALQMLQNQSDCEMISGSLILREAFGNVDRAALEKMDAVSKFQIFEKSLLARFNECKKCRNVIIDTHLIVVIRNNGHEIHEMMWSQSFNQWIKKAVLLLADPQMIHARRALDLEQTGRVRDLNVENIERDQMLNIEAFKKLIMPFVPEAVIWNNNEC
jgi:adenylate kinase